MHKRMIRKWLPSLLIGTSVLVVGLGLVVKTDHSYWSRMRAAKINLSFARRSISIFAKQNGRFPVSLHELEEYQEKFPDNIPWRFTPSESIVGKPNSREHSVLDGTGGLYYNPKTGELKLNLTKPLKSYWRFYLGEERNEVPADW